MSWGGFEDRDALRAAAEHFVDQAWHGDGADLSALVADNYQFSLLGRDEDSDLRAYVAFAAMVRAAIADLEVTVRDSVVQGDQVALFLTFRGRHVQPLFGIAPQASRSDGAMGALDSLTRLEFRERRVVRQYAVTDFSALQSLLGA